ncbi:MAG: tetratricopeptide repeat protein, partial [Thermoguttaceae bacterium]
LNPKTRPGRAANQSAEELYKTIQKTKIMSPATDCLSPIGDELLLKGLRREVNAEFYTSTTRSPAVYRGNPFQIEVALAYGGSPIAKKISREVLAEDPDRLDVHRAMAYVLEKQEKFDRAIHHCREALRIEPDDADTKERLDALMQKIEATPPRLAGTSP